MILTYMNKSLAFAASIAFAVPQMAFAQYYYSYPHYPQSINYSGHVFAPNTYVNTSPYVNVDALQYTYQSSYAYSYPSYAYSYPSYSYSYPSYNYSYPTYQNNYYDTYSYNYSGGNSYGSNYWWDDPNYYCYSGYGCYPMPVDDPHQWIYDHWTGNWY